MTVVRNIILSGFMGAFFCSAAIASGERPASIWSYFHFDGHRFVQGAAADGQLSVAVKYGCKPALLNKPTLPEATSLPDEWGAMTGLCYIQSSGGKLARGPAYLPLSGVKVAISSGSRVVLETKTDDNGYFTASLPAGKYRVRCKGDHEIETTVEKGFTTLLPLRVGKRMAD